MWKPALVIILVTGAWLYGRHGVVCPPAQTVKEVQVQNSIDSNISSTKTTQTVIQYVDRPVDHIITKTIIKEVTGKTVETTVDETHQGNTEVKTTKGETKEKEAQVKTEIVYKDKIVQVPAPPSVTKWQAGIGIGYGITGEGKTNYIPKLPTGSVVMGQLNHAILKDWIKGGVFATSRGDAGLQLLVEW
jgi:hypothetical protein